MILGINPDPALRPRVHAAIDVTKANQLPAWEDLCNSRDPRRMRSFGNRFHLHPDYTGDIEAVLRECEWSFYSSDSESVTLRTFDLPGHIGVADLNTLSPYQMVLLKEAKGRFEAQVYQHRGQQVPFSTIVLGFLWQAEGVWDFRAGPVMEPCTVEKPVNVEINVATALQMGMRWARCVGL